MRTENKEKNKTISYWFGDHEYIKYTKTNSKAVKGDTKNNIFFKNNHSILKLYRFTGNLPQAQSKILIKTIKNDAVERFNAKNEAIKSISLGEALGYIERETKNLEKLSILSCLFMMAEICLIWLRRFMEHLNIWTRKKK